MHPGQAGQIVAHPTLGHHLPGGVHHAQVVMSFGPVDPHEQLHQQASRLDNDVLRAQARTS